MNKHRHGLGNCGKCPTRDMCKVLCSEAEVYVDQDHVEQKELTIGLPKVEQEEEDSCVLNSHFTKTEKSILRFLILGYTRERICKLLKINTETYYVHTHNIRKKS
jgi:DNA-binding NarL/FixJ family response regulator